MKKIILSFIKRLFSMTAAVCVFAGNGLIVTAVTENDQGSSEKMIDKGWWEYDDIDTFVSDKTGFDDYGNMDRAYLKITCGDGKVSAETIVKTDIQNGYGHIWLKTTDKMTGSMSFTKPLDKYSPGDTFRTNFDVTVSGLFHRSTPEGDLDSSIYFRCEASAATGHFEDKSFTEERRKFFEDEKTHDLETGLPSLYNTTETSGSATFSGTIPEHEEGFDIMQIRIGDLAQATMGGGYFYVNYYYKWHSNLVPAEGGTESSSDSTSSQSDDSTWIIQNESRNALESAGEDSGTKIDAELVTGKKKHRDDDSSDNAKKGAAAATGAAVAAVTATTSVTSSRKKKVIYKMHIYKDFGNGIPVGRPVYLYARIAKYENGSAVGVTDAELTQKISIDFDLPPRYNEKLRSCVQAKKLYGVQNGYARFAVLISDNTATSVLADDELPLTVKFIFTGKGGSLTECVRFRMMGKPTAQLMLKTNSGFTERIGREHISAFLGRTYKDIPETHLLLGDRRPYSLYVKAKNFLYPAESIKLAYENADGSLNGRYTVTPVRVDNDIFELKIDNRTVASDDKCGEKPYVDGGFSVTLTNSHDEKGGLYIPLQFYHEGIFAYCSSHYSEPDRFKRACVEYHTNEIDENKLEHLRKTLIRICGAFRIEGASKDSESIVYLTEKPVKLSTELVGKDDEMKKILKNISTDIKLETDGDISLRPERVLLADDPAKEYVCELPVSVQKQDGSLLSGNIPLRVIGEPRNGEVYSWNKEVEFTKNMITLYNIKSLSGVRFDMWIKELYNHRFSPTELSIIRHRLYDIGVELEHERFRLAMNEAAFWDKCVMIAEAVKFADDIAFTITVRAIAITVLKKNPMYVEPVANAIKKFMEDVAAEWSMGKLDEEAIIRILMDTTFTFFEDLFINLAMLPDPYSLITLFVLASCINFCRHAVTLSMDKSNRNMGQAEILCKALTNCVIDMTVKGAVIAITKVLEKKVPGLSKFVEGDNIDVVIKNKKVTVDASGQIMKMLTKGHTFKGVWRNATLKQEILNICAEYALPGVMKMDDGHTLAIPFPSFSGTPDEEKMIDEAYDQMLAMNNTVSITMPGTDITLPVPKDLISIAVTTKLLDSLGMSKVMDFFDAVKTVKPPERFEYIPPRKLNESLIEYGWKKEADRLNEGLMML